jgi:hypothetical protein
MTIVLLLLSFVLVVGAGVGITLWRLLRSNGPEALPSGWRERMASTRSALVTYQPMSRLFAEEDFDFLAGQRGFQPGLEKKLRRQRRRVLRLYLRELRLEFRGVYALCRMLVPHSANPDFAAWITRQAAAFYGLLLVLHLRCTLGWFLHVRVDTTDLVTAFDRLREAARAGLPSWTLQPSPYAA